MVSPESSVVFLAALLLALLVAGAISVLLAVKQRRMSLRYRGIVDVDRAITERRRQAAAADQEFRTTERAHAEKSNELASDYQRKRTLYELLAREVSSLEDQLEMSSYGLYRPSFDFDTAEAYKSALESVRRAQKEMVRAKQAAVCPTNWQVEGSKREGQKMTGRMIKLMLRAFNGECDAAVLKVKWNNVTKMEERIRKAHLALNKLSETQHVSITTPYVTLKLKELRLAHEYAEKKHREKEEQRHIRQQIREEEWARKEIEKALSDAEAEEQRFEKALEAARRQAGAEAAAEVTRLQRLLDEAHSKKERAISRAQLTKSGHVYVISNIGSFGEDVYKIGVTRRLEPLERVKELGDASVPFGFDVHAMVFSEDAPRLEKEFHREFRDRQVNMVNSRKEFFRVALTDIEQAALKLGVSVEFTRLAEAQQYRETLAMLNERRQRAQESSAAERFPETLDGLAVEAAVPPSHAA